MACVLAADGLAAAPARLRVGEAACPAPRREAARHCAAGRPVRRRTPPASSCLEKGEKLSEIEIG